MHKLTDANGHSHVVLYDRQFILDEMSKVDRLFIDGTFSTAPTMDDVYQLLTIIGIKFGHVISNSILLFSSFRKAMHCCNRSLYIL